MQAQHRRDVGQRTIADEGDVAGDRDNAQTGQPRHGESGQHERGRNVSECIDGERARHALLSSVAGTALLLHR